MIKTIIDVVVTGVMIGAAIGCPIKFERKTYDQNLNKRGSITYVSGRNILCRTKDGRFIPDGVRVCIEKFLMLKEYRSLPDSQRMCWIEDRLVDECVLIMSSLPAEQVNMLNELLKEYA